MNSKFEGFLRELFDSSKKAGAHMIRLNSGDLGIMFQQYQESQQEDCPQDTPQAPEEFQKSDGFIGTFLLKPKAVTAIQFLGSNWTEVLSFLWLHQIPFVSCGSEVDYTGDGGAGRHIHIPPVTGNLTSETLSEGRWVYFYGKRGEDDYNVGVYRDEDFRDMFHGEKFNTGSTNIISAD